MMLFLIGLFAYHGHDYPIHSQSGDGVGTFGTQHHDGDGDESVEEGDDYDDDDEVDEEN